MTNDGNNTLVYDAENGLIAVGGNAAVSYGYDPAGRRIHKDAGGAWMEYFYGIAGQVTAERIAGSWPVEYAYVNGQHAKGFVWP